jgi:hypothetical protein
MTTNDEYVSSPTPVAPSLPDTSHFNLMPHPDSSTPMGPIMASELQMVMQALISFMNDIKTELTSKLSKFQK